jgi:hypothetical protein
MFWGSSITQAKEFLRRRQRLLLALGIIAAKIPELRETVASAINAIHSVESEPEVLMAAIILENCEGEAA